MALSRAGPLEPEKCQKPGADARYLARLRLYRLHLTCPFPTPQPLLTLCDS